MNSLFEPTTLAGLPLQNRIVMAPLTRNRADVMGVPQPYVRDYYSQRASAGLIISEGTQPSFAGQGYCRTPGMHTPDQMAAWKRVTDAALPGARRCSCSSCTRVIAHPPDQTDRGRACRALKVGSWVGFYFVGAA